MQQKTAARLAWSLWALVLLEAAAAITFQELQRGGELTIEDILLSIDFVAMGAVGALIASRQPGNAIGWLFLATTAGAGTLFLTDEYWRFAVEQGLPGAAWAAWLSDWLWIILLTLPVVFVPLLFPDGHLPSRRWRPFAWFAGAFMALAGLTFALDPAPRGFARLPNPVGVEAIRPLVGLIDGPGFFVVLLLGVGSLVSLILRFRRAGGQRRQQIKWFALGAAVLVTAFVLSAVLPLLGVTISPLAETIMIAFAYMALPLGAAIAILRHRLYDIDVVINRTVLFGSLAAVITAIYVAIVIGIGSLVGGRGNLFLSIVATAVVAVAFQPIRTRAGHFANRLVYGKRATPYEVLSTFSDHLGEAYSTEAILPRIARMIGEATGAERATVWVHVGDKLRPSAAWPETGAGSSPIVLDGPGLPAFPDGERAFAVRHQGELLGALSVTTSRREPLNETQERLLEDLAGQAGLVLRNVRLIEELRASRQRLVAAQDEERRRLERNIHDGAQQQLVALAVKIRLARTIADRDLEKAQSLLDQLQGEAQDALENLRDLARGIYPPLLADKGLAAALEAQARKAPFPVRVEPNGVRRYPADAEATAYFCVLEALQNVAKYAGASRVIVGLRAEDGTLVFTVQDDGRGFDPATTPRGSGLQNMADRLEALGGSVEVASAPGRGTSITGRIPVGERG